MITIKDLELQFAQETGNERETHRGDFTEFIIEKHLELVNQLKTVESFTADWVQACIEQEHITEPAVLLVKKASLDEVAPWDTYRIDSAGFSDTCHGKDGNE